MHKILIISHVCPFPIDHGKKVTLSGMLDYLIKRYKKHNVRYVVIGDLDYEIIPKKYDGVFINIPDRKSLVQLLQAIWYSFVVREKSIQESVLFSTKMQSLLLQQIAKFSPTMIICDTLRVGQFFVKTPLPSDVKKILYMDDLFSVRYGLIRKVLLTHNVDINVLGNFANNLPGICGKLLKSTFMTKWLLRHEQKLLQNREVLITQHFDKNLLVNANEVALLNEKTVSKNVFCLPPIVSQDRKYVRRFRQGNLDFIFLGSLNIAHNQYSLTTFISNHLSQIVSKHPKFRLRIIGKNATAEILGLAKKFPLHISLEGYVEDLANVMQTACGMLIPLLFGSGIKLKTLDAMSYGIPIITTDFGVEGLGVQDSGIIVENDLTKYVDHINLLKDKAHNLKTSKQIYDFFQKTYAKDQVIKQYDEIFS